MKAIKLTKTYGKDTSAFTALHEVSFELKDGSNLAILGKSGSGKSTLMHLLAGLDGPTSGIVKIDNVDVWKMKEKEFDKFRNQKIGFIFQSFYLQNENTVLENVMVPLEIRGSSNREEKAMEALEELEIADKANNKASDLSGGQKQRVVIARAIVGNPSIIFADEPTGNLDTKTGSIVENILFNLNKERGVTLITVTHDEELTERFANMIELSDGEIINSRGKGITI